MKVLLYSEGMKLIKVSGLGRAISHQITALKLAGIDVTTSPDDDYDIVHINTFGPKSKSLAKKAHKLGKPVIYHAHSTEEDFRNSFIFSNMFSGLFKKWICSCYRLGDCIITPTDYSKMLIDGYGLKKPVYAVSNGIDLNFFKAEPCDREKFRSAFGFTESDKVVIAVGLYLERKGILDFVEMAKKMPDYKFIWFGKTPLYSVPFKIIKAVKTKLPNLNFAGYVDPSILKTAYSGADIYIFPTHEETEGIVLLEALSCKSKVLVRDIPVFSWLEGGKDCYKSADNNDMMKKIAAIIDGSLPDLTESGYRKIEEKSLDKIGPELIKVYNEALKLNDCTAKPIS